MKTHCSCQICNVTSGEPHCRSPTLPRVFPASCSADAVCHLTEYRDRFHPHGNTAKRNSKKICPEYEPLEGEITANSTFQSDYVSHPVRQRSPKPIKAYAAPIGPMLLKSTYMNDFRMYPVHKNSVVKNTQVKEYKAPTRKMDTLSVYNDVYRAMEPQPHTQSYKTIDNLKVNEGILDMTTTSQVAYCLKTEPSTRKSFKPEQKLKESALPFEGKSVYRQMYIPHPVQRASRKPKIPYRPSSAPFQAMSTHQQDYKGDRSSAVQSCKVKASWEPRSTPFEGESECQDKFQAWPVRPATSARKAAQYSPPEGDAELTSMAHTDFRGAPGCPAISARPSLKVWSKGRPFEARSTTHEHYRAWEGAKRSKSLKSTPTRLPLPSFEGTTTFRAEFTPKKAENITSFKPVQRVLSPSAMESETVYRSTFKKYEVDPCPACLSRGSGGEVLSLGKNGYIRCQDVSPEESKVISHPSAARVAKSCHPTKTRPVRSAGLYRQNN